MRLLVCLATLALSAPAFTQTTVPPASTLTAGAEIKAIQFDWELSNQASYYDLEYRPTATSPFARVGGFGPTAANAYFKVSAHLFDWSGARFRIASCNSAGCSRSPAISVSGLRLDVVGYFKAAQSLIGIGFGADTDLTPNSANFVSAAPGDFINDSTGAHDGGAVYVFKRQPSGTWGQRARLTPPVPPFIEGGNVMDVAMSADANTVAVGMPNFWHSEFDENSGEVFVFRYNGSAWVRTRIPATVRGAFGRWIDLNDAGNTLAIGRGEYLSVPAPPRTIEIYRRVNSTWTRVASIDEDEATSNPQTCSAGSLSGDGLTVVQTCSEGGPSPRAYVRIQSGSNWSTRTEIDLELPPGSGTGPLGVATDRTADTIAARIFDGQDGVKVFERQAGIYQLAGTVRPGAWQNGKPTDFGLSLTLSGDGNTLAVGDSVDAGAGTGVRRPPLAAGGTPAGAVYLFRRGSTWGLRSVVKPNYPFTTGGMASRTFGHDVSLCANGSTLVVGQQAESSNAQGIGGAWNNTQGSQSGAVWLY